MSKNENYTTCRILIPNYDPEPVPDVKNNNEPIYLFQYEKPSKEVEVLMKCSKCGAAITTPPNRYLHTTDTGWETGIVHVWLDEIVCPNGCNLLYFDYLLADGSKAYDFEPQLPSYYDPTLPASAYKWHG